MSEENVPRDRRAQAEATFTALDNRDFETLGKLPFHPEMEFRSVIAAAEGGIYHGVTGLREWASAVDGTFDDFRMSLEEFRESDPERAVIVVHVRATAKASGVPIDARFGQVWTWRDGLMWRNEVYTDAGAPMSSSLTAHIHVNLELTVGGGGDRRPGSAQPSGLSGPRVPAGKDGTVPGPPSTPSQFS